VARVEQGQDVRVSQSRGNIYLAQEPLDADLRQERRVEHFDGDVAAMFSVESEIDNMPSHRRPIFAIDAISVSESASECFGMGGVHKDSS
jgi:hypothetical protein